jgi:hypothetical protein
VLSLCQKNRPDGIKEPSSIQLCHSVTPLFGARQLMETPFRLMKTKDALRNALLGLKFTPTETSQRVLGLQHYSLAGLKARRPSRQMHMASAENRAMTDPLRTLTFQNTAEPLRRAIIITLQLWQRSHYPSKLLELKPNPQPCLQGPGWCNGTQSVPPLSPSHRVGSQACPTTPRLQQCFLCLLSNV